MKVLTFNAGKVVTGCKAVRAAKLCRQEFDAYSGHADGCVKCRAAGLGYGNRCTKGMALWKAYENEFTNHLRRI